MNKATVRWVAVDLDADWRTYLPAKGRDRNAEYLGVVTVGLSERGAFEPVKTANRGQQDTYDYYLVSAGSRRPLDATKALEALKAAGAARDRMDLCISPRTKVYSSRRIMPARHRPIDRRCTQSG